MCMPEVCYSVCVIIWQQFTINCNVYARNLLLCLCHYMAAVHNKLQCVCQKFVTLFVLIRVSFASCYNEMSAQMN
jgi:hypothetical protein